MAQKQKGKLSHKGYKKMKLDIYGLAIWEKMKKIKTSRELEERARQIEQYEEENNIVRP